MGRVVGGSRNCVVKFAKFVFFIFFDVYATTASTESPLVGASTASVTSSVPSMRAFFGLRLMGVSTSAIDFLFSATTPSTSVAVGINRKVKIKY